METHFPILMTFEKDKFCFEYAKGFKGIIGI